MTNRGSLILYNRRNGYLCAEQSKARFRPEILTDTETGLCEKKYTHENLPLMKSNDWKERLNIVYSTNPDFKYDNGDEPEAETSPNSNKSWCFHRKKGRGGKTVTVIKGFTGTEDDLKNLGKLLKTKCGVGGSTKDGEILIQENLRQRIIDLLKAEGYTQAK